MPSRSWCGRTVTAGSRTSAADRAISQLTYSSLGLNAFGVDASPVIRPRPTNRRTRRQRHRERADPASGLVSSARSRQLPSPGTAASAAAPSVLPSPTYLQALPATTPAINQNSPWLFPGRRPSQPMNPCTLRDALRKRGLPAEKGRTSAIRQLVLQAPRRTSSPRHWATTTRAPPASPATPEPPGRTTHPATTTGDLHGSGEAPARRTGLEVTSAGA